MNRGIVDLVEAYQRKFNPSENRAGMLAANREIGEAVRVALVEKKLDANAVSFRHLWEALKVEKILQEGANLVSSAFPTITGQIISKTMIDAYDAFPTDAEALVRTVSSRMKVSRVVGWTPIGSIEMVLEKQDYPEVAPPAEKVQTIKNYKYGGLLSLTKEDLFFDQTGELLDRARQIGTEGARYKQELIFAAVSDINGTALSGADLYNAGNGNLITANPLSTDGWEAARAAMLAKKDERNRPIWVMGDRPKLIIPPGLLTTAEKLKMNQYGPIGTANLDVNRAQNAFDIVMNPYWTANQTTWWYGAPTRQFRWEEVWPLETYTRVGQDTEEGFKADVIQQFKCSFYGGAGAVDTKWVTQSDAT